MRYIRRAALVISLVLIVAVAVGAAVRTRQLGHERDLRLASAVAVGAEHLVSIVDAVALVTAAGSDAGRAASSLARLDDEVGVCVIDAIDNRSQSCAGDGSVPTRTELDELLPRVSVAGPGSTVVTVYDTTMTVLAHGPSLTTVLRAPTTIVDRSTSSGVRIHVATHIPNDDSIGGFVMEGPSRQTAMPVGGVPDVFVVGTGSASVELPDAEQTFYLLSVLLGAVLLALAGATVFFEHRHLQERASFDALTRLPNRSEFERQVAQMFDTGRREGAGLCLLLFDLDEFKSVNDNFGHAAGDDVLRVVGDRLRKAMRDGDAVARWGGDEFVAVMTGIGSEEMAGRRALQVADAVAGRARIDRIGRSIRIKVSVGVALWPAGAELDEVLSVADEAMYHAKREGTTCWVAEAPDTPQPRSGTWSSEPIRPASLPPIPVDARSAEVIEAQ